MTRARQERRVGCAACLVGVSGKAVASQIGVVVAAHPVEVVDELARVEGRIVLDEELGLGRSLAEHTRLDEPLDAHHRQVPRASRHELRTVGRLAYEMRVGHDVLVLARYGERRLHVRAKQTAQIGDDLAVVARKAAHRDHAVDQWRVVVVARYGLKEHVAVHRHQLLLLDAFSLHHIT